MGLRSEFNRYEFKFDLFDKLVCHTHWKLYKPVKTKLVDETTKIKKAAIARIKNLKRKPSLLLKLLKIQQPITLHRHANLKKKPNPRFWVREIFKTQN